MYGMKTLLKIEELAMFLLGCFAYAQLEQPWWIFFALFLTPDIGFAGYLHHPRTGAFTYNLLHHKGIALLVWVIGTYLAIPSLEIAGCILFAHSSFDRIFGYGLKFNDSFHHTHLGIIGKTKLTNE